MTLNSMTGFARAQGLASEVEWAWELRAVNGKGLDVRLRIPNGFESLEAPARKLCSGVLSRGNVQVSLTVSKSNSASLPRLNTAVLDQVLAALKTVNGKADLSPSSGAELLALRGVLEIAEPEMGDAERDTLNAALLQGLNDALLGLNEYRSAEGAALLAVLSGHMDSVAKLTAQAAADPSLTPEAIKDRFQKQLALLGDALGETDQNRVAQEIAILTTKADINEELDRLRSHVDAARDLLAKGSPIGRKLEFLAQEFNRETNTLCSKSNAISLTETGLELKVVIDQFREQILNVE